MQYYIGKNFGRKASLLPPEVNWKNKGVLTPIKNQGRTSYCAILAAIASMESLITIRSREDGLLSDSDPPVELSTQYFIDYFANKYGNKGFKVARLGLNMLCIMDFLETHGIPLEKIILSRGLTNMIWNFLNAKQKCM
jgi:hypothetical protein